MVRVAPVQLQYNPKSYWFDPKDLDLIDGDRVIVSTERGKEYGICSGGIIEVEDEAVSKLKSPLKSVLRLATEEDLDQVDQMRQKSQEALPVFKRLAAEENENMRPIMVDYLFDGTKATFYFEAEERVDFRELVRKLSDELKVRVDMRQVGVRDEARIIGGLGHCGQELCCRRLGGEFCPVSIRMAKEQDLSLNPQKISGVCGRLMCCLRYEYDAYKDFKSRAPKRNATISTPSGKAKVVDLNIPKEMVTVQLEEEGKRVTFPLSAMDEPEEEGKRPNSIGEAFEEYANPDPFANSALLGIFDTAGFTQEDKLGAPEARHNAKKDEVEDKSDKKSSRRRRRRKSSSAADGSRDQGQGSRTSSEGKGKSSGRSRRRRGSQKSGSAAAARPGQNSSGLSGAKKDDAAQPPAQVHRKSRRRSHKSGKASDES